MIAPKNLSLLTIEYSRFKRYSNFALWSVLLILFVFIFNEPSRQITNNLLVRPVFSSIHVSNWFIDTTCILFSIIAFIYAIFHGIKQVRISPVFVILFFTIAIIYSAYRIGPLNEYDFVNFKIPLLNHTHLLDVLYIGPVSIVLFYTTYLINHYRHNHSKKKKASRLLGFYTDAPIKLDLENDIFSRRKYIEDIKNRILHTYNTENSFAIGIIGPWGSGKTTFLNGLKRSLDQTDIIQIKFNPWVAKDKDSITPMFLSDLAIKLSEYDTCLKRQILEYSDRLLQGMESTASTIAKSMFSLASTDKDLQSQYNILNQTISTLNKKVVVYVDDVDRLDNQEVIEVLKLIRNSASFGNVFFIVAFDKVYVTKSINAGLLKDSEKYLEKIFQLEYYLPLHPDKAIYSKAFYKELRSLLDNENELLLDKIENPENGPFNLEILPPVEHYINTYRDINRFMNIFLLNYERIQNNVYLPDYISICLFRLKYPEVYNSIYRNKYNFLTQGDNASMFHVESGELFLKFEGEDYRNLENTSLYIHLKENVDRYALNEHDLEDVVKLFAAMFTTKQQITSFQRKRTLPKCHLSIVQANFFNRYFDYSIDGRLDHKEFEDALKLPLQELLTKITQWNTSRSASTDLIVYFENIDEFKTRHDFEKIIRAIVYFADLPTAENPNYDNMFNAQNFYGKLGGNDNQFNAILNVIYEGNKEQFKTFFQSLILTDPPIIKWRFIHEFCKTLISEYGNNFLIPHKELNELIRDSFLIAAGSLKSFTRDIMQFYNHAIRLFLNPDIHEIITPTGDGVEMTNIMRDLIKADVSDFLEWCLFAERVGAKKYHIGSWYKIFFSKDEFEALLEEQKNHPKVKEYVEFYLKYKSKQSPDYPENYSLTEFDFKHFDPR